MNKKICGYPGGNLLQSSLEVDDTYYEYGMRKKVDYHLRKGDG